MNFQYKYSLSIFYSIALSAIALSLSDIMAIAQTTPQSIQLTNSEFLSQSTKPKPPTKTQQELEDPKVLVSEVVVTGAEGELENQVYDVIRTKPGKTTTRDQLQEDINAIFGTGYFSNVQGVPTDTPLGLRVTFAVKYYTVFSYLRFKQ